MSTSKRIANALLVVLAFTCLCTSTSRASCPTGWAPGASSVTYNIILPSCPLQTSSVTIRYCIPTGGTSPATQYYIDTLIITPACAIGAADYRTIGKVLIEANPANFACTPNCPQVNPDWRVHHASCVKRLVIQGQTFVYACPTGDGACIDLYHVCCNAQGLLQATWVGGGATTDCTDEACVPVCEP